MLNIYLSDINAGTSERLCAMMVKESLVHPEDSFIFIVPEQSTQQMQRMTVSLHPFHVVMNIDITSFDRLALKVFNEHSAQSCNILDETGKVLILRKILNACRNDLSVYGKKALMPGFASRVKSVLSELAQYDVDDNGLFLMQESARKRKDPLLYAKLQDIRLIRQEFYREMGDAYQTSQDLMSAFSKLIKDSAMIRGSHIYLDGFTGFTPVQYRLIEELLKYCPDVNIALVLPADYEAQGPKGQTPWV